MTEEEINNHPNVKRWNNAALILLLGMVILVTVTALSAIFTP